MHAHTHVSPSLDLSPYQMLSHLWKCDCDYDFIWIDKFEEQWIIGMNYRAYLLALEKRIVGPVVLVRNCSGYDQSVLVLMQNCNTCELNDSLK